MMEGEQRKFKRVDIEVRDIVKEYRETRRRKGR